jgi:hypothetical protein
MVAPSIHGLERETPSMVLSSGCHHLLRPLVRSLVHSAELRFGSHQLALTAVVLQKAPQAFQLLTSLTSYAERIVMIFTQRTLTQSLSSQQKVL